MPPIDPPKDTKYVRQVRLQSKLLTEFWGRPIFLEASVLVPRDFDTEHRALSGGVLARAFPERFFGFSETPGGTRRASLPVLPGLDFGKAAAHAASGHAPRHSVLRRLLWPQYGITGENFTRAAYAITSPPAIYRDLVIVGPSTQESPSAGPSGNPRAYDARTGKLVWRFHTVPQPGEPNDGAWGPDGWKNRAGPSLWGLINVDTQRGLVSLATGNPADSFFGGDRKGTDLYANCVLALDAATGKLRWHYQLVHHDIFDYDVPGASALTDAVRNRGRIPAVAQITKMGLLYILDRMTGEPVFGVKEVPVPPSDVPGEEAWPTQPFPLKPPPLSRISIRREELTTRTPEAARYCRETFDKMQVGSVFTPSGTKTTLIFPGLMGAGNWGGVSFDPSLSYVTVNTSTWARSAT